MENLPKHRVLSRRWSRLANRVQCGLQETESFASSRVRALGLCMCASLALLACLTGRDFDRIYGVEGLTGDEVRGALGVPLQAYGVLTNALGYLGLPPSIGPSILWGMLFACLAIYITSRFRAASIAAAWALFLLLENGAGPTGYGAIEFINIGLFYCTCGNAFSGRYACTTIIVFRLHLCIVYISSGIEKASGAQWWSGEAIWRALARPDFGDGFQWASSFPTVLLLAGVGTVALETLYPAILLGRKVRALIVAATLSMHASIALLMELYLFSFTMVSLNSCAWLGRRRSRTS